MIKRYKDFIKEGNVGMGSGYYTEYPYQYNTMDNPSDRGKEGNVEYHKKENMFQNIQDEIKNIIVSKNPSFDEQQVEDMLMQFFSLGDYKKDKIREISDNCKNIKKCAEKIYNKYSKTIEINNHQDDINDIEQDSVVERFE